MVYIHPRTIKSGDSLSIHTSLLPGLSTHIMTGIVEILTARRGSLRPFRAYPLKASRSRSLSQEEERSHTQNLSSSSPPSHSISFSPSSTFLSFPSTVSSRSSSFSSSYFSSSSSSSSSSPRSSCSVSPSSFSSYSSSLRRFSHSQSSSRSSSSLTPLLSGLLPLSSLPSSSSLTSRVFSSLTASSSPDTSSFQHFVKSVGRRRRPTKSVPPLLRKEVKPCSVLPSQKEREAHLSFVWTSRLSDLIPGRVTDSSCSIRRRKERITHKWIDRDLGLFTNAPKTCASSDIDHVSTEGRDEVYCHGSGVYTPSSWRRSKFKTHSLVPFSLLEKRRSYSTLSDLHLSGYHERDEIEEAREEEKEEEKGSFVPPQGQSEAKEERLPTLPGVVEDVFEVVPHAPRRCSGCGVEFQSDDPSKQGYLAKEKKEEWYSDRYKVLPKAKGVEVDFVPDGVEVLTIKSPRFRQRTRLLLCRRCYRIQMYKHLDGMWEAHANEQDALLPSQPPDLVINTILKSMKKESIVFKIVDICDLETSVVPELFHACRTKRLHVIWLINRIDCLPRTANRDKVKEWVRRMVRQIKNVHIDDCVLISAATGEGFEDLERRLEILLQTNERSSINLAGAGRRGGGPASAGSEEAGGGRLHLYVVGRVNAGKSTFVNRLLKFINYRHAGTIFMKRATGGVTRSALPGTTLSFISFGLPRGYKLIDTPGIPSNTQMTSRLPYAADLFSIVPSKRLQPITYALTEGKTLLIGAMVRIDLVGGSTALITCYFSHKVTLHICKTVKAADLLKRKACTFLYPPHLPDGFDKIQPLVKHRVKVYAGSNCAYDDISIAGLGWVSISGGSAGMKELDVWAPEGVKIFRRPAMLPLQLRITGVEEFHGKSPRARGPRINVKKKKMVEALRDQERREKLHAELAEREERFLSSHATHLFPSNSDSSNSELPSECSSIAKISSAYDGEDEENVREKEIGEKGEGEKEENRKREAMRTDVRSPCFSSSSVLSSLDLNEAPPSSSSILLEKREKKTNRREGRRSSEDENEEEEGVILGGGGIDRDLINQHGEYQEESRGIKMRCNSLDSSAHVATDESSWVSLVLDRERRLVEEKGLERERDRHEEEEEEKTRMTTYHPDSPLVAAGMKEEIEALLSQVANEEKELEKVRFQEKDKATDAETRDVRIQKQL